MINIEVRCTDTIWYYCHANFYFFYHSIFLSEKHNVDKWISNNKYNDYLLLQHNKTIIIEIK